MWILYIVVPAVAGCIGLARWTTDIRDGNHIWGKRIRFTIALMPDTLGIVPHWRIILEMSQVVAPSSLP